MNDQHEMDEPDVFDGPPRVTSADMPEPPHPVNWNLLTAHELEQEWLALNRWVEWLRKTYALYGFTPLDTPVIEASEVLLAKGGGETEKQIYRFQKGDSDLSQIGRAHV